VGERSQQVKAREVSRMNVVIGLKWVWRERGIVNAARPGGILVADTRVSAPRMGTPFGIVTTSP
jgi:hypothetical protein